MKKFSITAGFGLAMLCGTASAADLSFSGFFDADVAGYYDTADSTSDNFDFQTNHEMDLTATIKLNDKASVDLYATTQTTGTAAGAGAVTVPAKGGAPEDRWTEFYYDGFMATYQATSDLTLYLGDLSYSSGVFNYYNYKRPSNYAVGMTSTGFRGMQADFMGATLAFGADGSDFYGIYGAYNATFGSSNVKPFVMYRRDEVEDSYNLNAGFDGTLVFGDQKVQFAYGVYKNTGDEVSQTFAVEPILAFGDMTLAATAYLAILHDEDAAPVSVPEWMFFYAEPGYTVNSVFSVGLPLEYHTMTTDSDEDLSEVWVSPTLYFAIGEGCVWSVWEQTAFRTGSDIGDKSPYFGVGSELSLNF